MEPTKNEDTPNAAEDRAQDTDFQNRHKKELGVGAYAKRSVAEGLLPVLTMVGGGLIGYMTLGKPIKKFFPSVVNVTDMGADALSLIRENGFTKIPNIMEKVQNEFAEVCKEVDKKHPGLNPLNNNLGGDSKEWLSKVLEEIKDHDQMAKFRAALGLPPSDALGTAKYWGAAAGAIPGSLIGGTVVGYRQWKRDESTRVAAAEISEDVARLELFRPSDPELVAENKRLRAMLAKEDKGAGTDVPETAGISQIKHEGAVKASELSTQVG